MMKIVQSYKTPFSKKKISFELIADVGFLKNNVNIYETIHSPLLIEFLLNSTRYRYKNANICTQVCILPVQLEVHEG